MVHYILVAFLLISSIGCTSVQKRESELKSQLVYATNDSLKVSRVDRAQYFSNELVKITTPPKKRIAIRPFISNSTKYVVLPKDFSSTPIVTVDSKEFKLMLAREKVLEQQINQEKNENIKLAGQVDKLLIDKDKELEKLRQEHKQNVKKKWWSGIFWGFSLLGILAIIALLVFFPALWPIFLGILGTLRTGINSILLYLGKLFKKK